MDKLFYAVISYVAFIFILILTLWGIFGYIGYSVTKNPEIIGEGVGKIVNGYEKERKEQPQWK